MLGYRLVIDAAGAHVYYDGGEFFRPGATSIDNPGDFVPASNIGAVKISNGKSLIRIGICRSCPSYRSESDKCGTCGCSSTMTEASKSPWRSCPEGKWPSNKDHE
jgi:hypothetical protein